MLKKRRGADAPGLIACGPRDARRSNTLALAATKRAAGAGWPGSVRRP